MYLCTPKSSGKEAKVWYIILLPQKKNNEKKNYSWVCIAHDIIYCTSNPSEKDLLLDILRRLERLEDHCKINPDSEGHGVASSSISVSSDFTRSRPASIDLPHSSQPRTPNTQSVVHSMLNGIKDDRARSLLASNVFCHLRNVESRLFENETCVKAVEAAMAEVERLESAREVNVLDPPAITKEMAKRWVKCACCSRTWTQTFCW